MFFNFVMFLEGVGGGAMGLRIVTLLAAGAAVYGAWSNLR